VLGSLCTEENQTDLAPALKKPAFSEGTGKTAEQTDCADLLQTRSSGGDGLFDLKGGKVLNMQSWMGECSR